MENTYAEKENSPESYGLCSSKIRLPVKLERRFVKKLVNRLNIPY